MEVAVSPADPYTTAMDIFAIPTQINGIIRYTVAAILQIITSYILGDKTTIV